MTEERLRLNCSLDNTEILKVVLECDKKFAYVETFDYHQHRCCIALHKQQVQQLIAVLTEIEKEL